MQKTMELNLNDTLPLTCSRAGTCCHGKNVMLNPWELARLAKAKNRDARSFRDEFCHLGGIQLRFDGPLGYQDLPACSQYVPEQGCSVHGGRPLACRLYPLGRQLRGESRQYIYQGKEFPCLQGCPEVVDLPQLSVEQYIAGQEATAFEKGQDEYLEFMQNLAEGAFALLLDSGLAESGDKQTLQLWRKMGEEPPEKLAGRLSPQWMDLLMLPDIQDDLENPRTFSARHYEFMQTYAQQQFGSLENFKAISAASVVMMAMALHLGRGLGVKPGDLADRWVREAKKLGARD